MISLFIKGGLIMWPLLLTSIIAVTVVIERLVFVILEKRSRSDEEVEQILSFAEQGKLDEAVKKGRKAKDFVARILVYGLSHRHDSFSNALLLASKKELRVYSRGLPILDTIITLAPLLGLFGTVTGMIHAFGLLGDSELGAPTAITGGIAEALIATAFGLIVAILALIPYNYLNTKLEEARQDIEEAASHLELLLLKGKENA